MSVFCSGALRAEPAAPATATPTPAKDQKQTATDQKQPAKDQKPPPPRKLYIREYRVRGAHQLPPLEVEQAVYPFLGPARTEADIELARTALEKAYRDQGWQTVSVEIPEQTGQGGIIVLQVTEAKVGRLRVHGSRYFSLSQIKRSAPSMAEGKLPNFNDVTRDIVALNQLPDRRVTPSLRAGEEPGTVDIDLNVQDTLPLHGTLELNNRYSPDTTELRLNGSVSYNNLWQLGHSAGVSYQVAPDNADDAQVYSGFYTMRFPEAGWLSLTLQGTKQDSNVSTLGGAAVAGRGEIAGLRVAISLPPGKNFYQSVSFGLDYKHFDQDIFLTPGGVPITAPITYYPLSVLYSANWVDSGSQTALDAGLNVAFRGAGSNAAEFENSRYNTDGSYMYFKGDLSRTQELPWGFQLYGKVQGQLSSAPLVSSEQISGGGLDTVRGYLEGEVPADNAIFGTVELRTPSLAGWIGLKNHELRLYSFFEGGRMSINDPLPEQQTSFDLASYGEGIRLSLIDHLSGSLDAGIPLYTQSHTVANSLLLTFRFWADF